MQTVQFLNPRTYIAAGYFGLLGLFAVEFTRYTGVVGGYLFFDLWVYVLLFLFFVVVLRLACKDSFSDWWLVRFNNFIVIPISLLTAFVLFGVETYNHVNFVFATYGLNHVALVDLMMLGFFFSVVTLPVVKLRKYWQVILLFAFLLSVFFLYNYFFIFFLEISLNASGGYDDNFMEWLQVGVLVAGVVVASLLALRTKKNVTVRACYILVALFMIFMAAEEISYGERILPFAFPTIESGHQDEFNVHNQVWVNSITALLYVFAFVYALLSWGGRRVAEGKGLVRKKYRELWSIFSFRGGEVLYFLPTFIFNPYADRTLFDKVQILGVFEQLGVLPDFIQTLIFLAEWRETFEVLFYLAIVLHFVNIYIERRKGEL